MAIYRTLPVPSFTLSNRPALVYAYDEFGRVTSTWEGEPTTGKQLTAQTYDTVAEGEAYGSYT